MALSLLAVSCGQGPKSFPNNHLTSGKVVGAFSKEEISKVEGLDKQIKSVVAVIIDQQFRCSGVIVSETEVVTAGHCVMLANDTSKKDQLDFLWSYLKKLNVEDKKALLNLSIEDSVTIVAKALNLYIDDLLSSKQTGISFINQEGGVVSLVPERMIVPRDWVYVNVRSIIFQYLAQENEEFANHFMVQKFASLTIEKVSSFDKILIIFKENLKDLGATISPVYDGKDRFVPAGKRVFAAGFGQTEATYFKNALDENRPYLETALKSLHEIKTKSTNAWLQDSADQTIRQIERDFMPKIKEAESKFNLADFYNESQDLLVDLRVTSATLIDMNIDKIKATNEKSRPHSGLGHGDSGGGLFYLNEQGEFQLIGVASYRNQDFYEAKIDSNFSTITQVVLDRLRRGIVFDETDQESKEGK